MLLKTRCPRCNTAFGLDARLAGKKFRCKHCKQPFTPAPEPGPTAAPAPGTSRLRRGLALGIAAGFLVLAGLILLVVLLSPGDVDQRLKDLQADRPAQRERALLWLAEADPQDAHRARVTGALEPLLFQGDPRKDLNPDLVLRAYLRWAGRDNVPALVRLVENPSAPAWSPAKTGLVMETLGKLQDVRAADVLARKLADPALRDQAVTALQLLGPGAEKAVVPYAFDPDPATRQRADQLLADYGTKPRTVLAAAVDLLKSNQKDLQRSAAAWLADNPPEDAGQKPEVSGLLANLLDSLSPKVDAQALRALKVWGTRDNLPRLLALARREEKAGRVDPALIDVLAQFPDETAAEAIALQLKNPSARAQAVQGLMKLGPAATKAILPYLNHPDPAVRKEVRGLCRLLQIPTGAQLDQTLADLAAGKAPRVRAALESLARLRPAAADRPRVSRALNAPLLDADPDVRAAALKAVQVWGSKENTATLLQLLKGPQGGRPDSDGPVIEVLAALQDPAAAPTLAQGLTYPPERVSAARALRALGPGAEGAVLPFLQSRDPAARLLACQVLADIGTAKSLDPLQQASLANPTDSLFARQAEIAAQKIKART